MKKLVLVLAIALIVAPSFGALTLTLERQGTTNKVDLKYSDANALNLPRGFALTVSVSGGAAIDAVTAAKIGVSTQAAPGYGIFPGTIVINGSGVVTDNGSPLAAAGDPGALDQVMPSSSFVIELGSLYAPVTPGTDVNSPLTAGTLCTFDVNCAAATGDISISVAEEEVLRGGIVLENGAMPNPALTASLPYPCAPPETITGTPVVVKDTAPPAIAGRVNAVRAESFTASGVASSLGHTLEYQFNWGDGSALVWGTATQTHTFATATTVAWTTNVTVQARCAADTAVVSAVSAAIAETGESLKSTNSAYADWAAWNRPICWTYQRQCRGDINGTKNVNKWVQALDLSALTAAYGKSDADLALITNGICADINHTKNVNKRVQALDLGVLTSYYGKADADVPVCDVTTVNFWTN
ncbi:MAG: hypothetical protein WCW64_10625 [Phycisphaerae bacterium]|jgi:hypothetical protein